MMTAEDQTQYPISDELRRRIENTFMYHATKGDQQQRYKSLRDAAKRFAYLVSASVPPGREQQLALTKLEECVMHANAGIARGE